MTERPSLSLLVRREPNEQHNALLPAEPIDTLLSLGHLSITLDDPDFRHGYEQGRDQYDQWHRDDLTIDAALLLSLVRNGWGSQRYSEMWQTGYIVGWLSALFTHAYGLGGA